METGGKLVYDKERRTIVAQRTLAAGCCSAISPCAHQRREPYSICRVCQEAKNLYSVPDKD